MQVSCFFSSYPILWKLELQVEKFVLVIDAIADTRNCYEMKNMWCSFPGPPSEDRNLRSDVHELEMEEASFSGQEDSSEHDDILEWAKVKSCLRY